MMTKYKPSTRAKLFATCSLMLLTGLSFAQQVPNSLPAQSASVYQAQPSTGQVLQQTNQVNTAVLPSENYVPPAKTDISYKAFTPEGIMIIQKEVSEDARLERSAIPSDLDFSEFKKIGLNDPARLNTYTSLNKLREDALKNKVSYRAKHVNSNADVAARNASIWSTLSNNLLALASIAVFIICFLLAMAPSKPPKDILDDEDSEDLATESESAEPQR